MKYLQPFDSIVEKLGISDNVLDSAREYYNIITQEKDKFEFDFTYKINNTNHSLKIKIEPTLKQAGYFNGDMQTATIVLNNRNNFEVLAHELKHADRWFRMGDKAYAEPITTLFSITDYKKINSLFPYKFRNIFFLFYFLQKEEFEAHFHSDWIEFSELCKRKNVKTKEQVLQLWSLFKPLTWGLYNGTLDEGDLTAGSQDNIKMKIPKQILPFKFSNWCENDVIDSVIWTFLKSKRNLKDDDNLLFKALSLLAPRDVINMFITKPPAKYKEQINKYKQDLEKKINERLNTYRKKYYRIPLRVIDSLDKKNRQQ